MSADTNIIDLPLLTFAIEIPVEHFFKTVAFLNCGGSFLSSCMQKVTGLILRKTQYFDSHHWAYRVRCASKNIGYTLRSHEYNGMQSGRSNTHHTERQMTLFTIPR